MAVEASCASNEPSPHTPRCPGVWGGVGMVALYFVLQLVVALALVMLAGFGYGIVHGTQGTKEASAAFLQWLHTPDVKTGFTVVTIAVVAVLMLWIIRYLWREQWQVADPPGFGFVAPRNSLWFLYAVLAGIAVVLLGGLLTNFLAHGHPVHQDVSVMGRHVTFGMRIVLAVLVVCVAPLVEELIFRGVLLSGLMRRMHAGWAVAVSALVFGCVHLPDFGFVWYAIPALVLLGVVLALVRLRSRSLWPSVLMHATNNFVATIGWFAVMHPHA